MSYENWKIAKALINYSGDDEEKQEIATVAQKEYAAVANWCNQSGEYHIAESGEYVINLTTEKLVKETDFCGVKSGRDLNKWTEMNLTKEPAEKR